MKTATLNILEKCVLTHDGFLLSITLVMPEDLNRSEAKIEKVAIISSGMGNRHDKYLPFAKYLAAAGWVVVTYDNRGIGASKTRLSRESGNGTDHQTKYRLSPRDDIKLTDWGEIDTTAILDWINTRLKPSRIDYFGHSIGGQVVGLIGNARAINNLVLVAAQNGYWPLWGRRYRYVMRLGWSVIAASSKIFGGCYLMFLAGSESLPASIALDWKRWAMKLEFTDRNNQNLDLLFARFELPILAISLSDDNIYAPKSAVDSLLEKFCNAKITRWHIHPNDLSLNTIGHFGFFDPQTGPSLWPSVLKWLEPSRELDLERDFCEAPKLPTRLEQFFMRQTKEFL